MNAEADTALSDYAPSTFDATSDTVLLDGTQGAITFGQVKIVADVSGEGALDIQNIHASGFGTQQRGIIGERNEGTDYGALNTGGDIGQWNHSSAGSGQTNQGGTAGLVSGGGAKSEYHVGNVEVVGQVKIVADAAAQGALHIVNQHLLGFAQYNDGGGAGLYNVGGGTGQVNRGVNAGLQNEAITGYGQINTGPPGQPYLRLVVRR